MKKLEIVLKNLLLRILLSFNKSNKGAVIPCFNRDSKILCIRLNRIGDALVTTPFLKYISDNLNCRIDILADRKNYFIFESTLNKYNIFIYNKGLTGLYKLITLINRTKYNVIIDLHDDVSTTVSFIIALSKAPFKFALQKENKIIFTHTINRLAPENNHVIYRLFELSKLFSLTPPPNANIDFVIGKESEKYADEFIKKHHLMNKYLLGINISAGSEARFWGGERFNKLVEFFSKYHVSIILLTAPNDIKKAEIISNGKYPVFYSHEFDKFCSIIPKLNFLFTPDTSIVHIASAFKIPLFGIYVKYNTNDIIWYPIASKYEAVITTEPNFKNLDFEALKDKLKIFFENTYNEEKNTLM
jgi:ADP-heptose:LPS heptosyltransferase